MRSIAFFCALSLFAASPDAVKQEQTLHHLKQFAATSLDRVACVQAASPSSAKTITIEFGEARRGAPASIDATSILQEVFAVSSQTEFHWDHQGSLAGKAKAVYNYSYQINGKTHAGSIFADETTGAISRITVRGADAPAHLFCSAQSR